MSKRYPKRTYTLISSSGEVWAEVEATEARAKALQKAYARALGEEMNLAS